jgi:hypothetical protein
MRHVMVACYLLFALIRRHGTLRRRILHTGPNEPECEPADKLEYYISAFNWVRNRVGRARFVPDVHEPKV